MYWRRVRMVVTLTVLLVLVVKGAYDTIYPPNDPVGLRTSRAEIRTVLMDPHRGAENYAVYFTHFWLTGNPDQAKKYVAEGIELPSVAPKPRKVESINAWTVKDVGNNRILVTVRALLDQKQVVFLSVPVVCREGTYGVIGLPTFVPEPKTADAPEEESIQPATDPTAKQAIRSVVESFFRQYTAGTPEDLALLYQDGKERKVLDGSLEARFLELQSILVGEPVDGKVRARVQALLEVNGQSVPQAFEFYLTQSGGRWLIDRTIPEIPVK